jgi:hypothetical protein
VDGPFIPLVKNADNLMLIENDSVVSAECEANFAREKSVENQEKKNKEQARKPCSCSLSRRTPSLSAEDKLAID